MGRLTGRDLIAMDKELTLQDILSDFWQAKFYMLAGGLICCLLAFIYILQATPKYKATMIVAPADGYALGDYASKIEYDRIAALPFWRPTDQEGASTDFYRFIYTLRGPASSNILIKDTHLMTGLNKTRKDKIQTPEELSEYLSKTLRVDPLGATPLRKIIYHHQDPEFASALLRKIHLVADQMIRRDRRRQSQSRIEYLENSLKGTVNPDHRKGITNLLMQQEHIKMLADLDEAYAAIVVEPASATSKAVWPHKPLIFFIAVAIGAGLGLLIWQFSSRKQKEI